eukprot:PITA_36612
MAKGEGAKPIAGFLLVLNFCMYTIVCGTAGWAINEAIKHEIITGVGIPLPNPLWALYFPMGNAATGFLVIFALIAGVVGAASCISGMHHMRLWSEHSLSAVASSAMTAWALTLLAMGLAFKEIHLHGRNSHLKTMEAFVIILSATQFFYILLIHSGIVGK